MRRREFIELVSSGIAAATLPSCKSRDASLRHSQEPLVLLSLEQDVNRPWLGENFWANRLQDWQLTNGKIECRADGPDLHCRTAHLLTHDLNANQSSARIRAEIQNLNPEQPGFGGFLIGAGGGKLDHRSASLIHYGGGLHGGILAVIESDGTMSFRDFSKSEKPLSFDKYALDQQSQAIALNSFTNGSSSAILDCHLDALDDGTYDLRLIASDAQTGEELGFIVKTGVPPSILSGNIALISSPIGESGARFSFKDIALGGPKVSVHPERALGPVMGCLHSLNRNVLKLTAQFMPIDSKILSRARLDYRRVGTLEWVKGPTEEIGAGFTALFRVEHWRPQNDYEYQIVGLIHNEPSLFEGQIPKDPGADKSLKIALHSCLLPTSRPIDRPTFKPGNTLEDNYDRYDAKSLIFPHNTLVHNCDGHDPDLYVFLGDQYYETFPTRYGRTGDDRELDTLYRWYLWFWTFRDSLRDHPCIVLADDHDILQGNVWGNGGDGSNGPAEEDGGFLYDKDLVRMVYRMQCGHNPDNYDPTPILNNIPVSYGHFVYGGTSFAFVEDRKWKTPPNANKGVPLEETSGNLLGERQESFLKAWKDIDKGLPKVCLTASIWGSPQTDKNLDPLVDYDANGYPPDGRTRAVKLLKEANSIAIAGDQHLGMVARQGVKSYEDGPAFFAGPAGAAFWQRWFEGRGRLNNQFNNNPDTGNFVDCFGNKMRVMAVANPKITHLEFVESKEGWGYFVGDSDLKSEGYGIVVVDHKSQNFVFECWSWDAEPSEDEQFAGWPINIPFDKAGSA